MIPPQSSKSSWPNAVPNASTSTCSTTSDEASIEVYLDEQWGIADYFVEQKKNGRIRHLGFSCHGCPETLKRFLDYGARKYAELKQRDPETAALVRGQ